MLASLLGRHTVNFMSRNNSSQNWPILIYLTLNNSNPKGTKNVEYVEFELWGPFLTHLMQTGSKCQFE